MLLVITINIAPRDFYRRSDAELVVRDFLRKKARYVSLKFIYFVEILEIAGFY